MHDQRVLAGDILERAFHTIGIDRVARLYEKLSGRDCGCRRRKAKLNDLHRKFLVPGRDDRNVETEPIEAKPTEPKISHLGAPGVADLENQRVTIQLSYYLDNPRSPVPFDGIRRHALTRWAEIAKLVNREQWDRGIAQSLSMRGEYFAFVGFAKGRRTRLSERAKAMSLTHAALDDALSTLIPTLTDPLKRDLFKAALEAGGHAHTVESLSDELRKQSLAQRARSMSRNNANSFAEDLAYASMLATYGYWGGFLSYFNHYYKLFDKAFSTDEIEDLSQYLQEHAAVIEEAYLKIYSAFVSQKQDELLSISMDILHELAGRLDHFARLAAAVSKALANSLKQGVVSPRTLGTVALHAGMIARDWLSPVTTSVYSIRLALLPTGHDEVSSEFRRVQKLGFESRIEDGRNMTVKELVDLELDTSRYVEVQGIVRKIGTVRTEDGKLLSHFLLTAPSGAHQFPVIAIYENLPNIGISEGSYVRVNGDCMSKSNVWAEPHIQLRKLKLQSLGKGSWRDHMTDVTKRWFETYPNNYFISWSLTPQDASDPSRPLTGASEIIFKKPN